MNCPKCGAAMEPVPVPDIEAVRCKRCGGVWADALELEEAKAQGAIRQVDVGDSFTGNLNNTVVFFPCPKCGGAGDVIRMVAPDQPHIWFEHCAVCHGSYFDAGELTDWAEHTFFDHIRDLLTRERT